MPVNQQYCFVIPIYNHHETIGQTVAGLLQHQLPIFIVDDGSNEITKQTLARLAEQHGDAVQLHTLAENQGKGGAVLAGLSLAEHKGFTHALQVDADGQHNLADIPAFLALSQRFPAALVSGLPQYDESIPLIRKFGRKITHFWVAVQTLSGEVKDTMCGFRVYPLAAVSELQRKVQLGRRMDFDIEVMVRLYWQGLSVKFVPTAVIYPEGGRSHFHAFKDNWLIAKLHTRLVFGMLWRAPKLIMRNFKAQESE